MNKNISRINTTVEKIMKEERDLKDKYASLLSNATEDCKTKHSIMIESMNGEDATAYNKASEQYRKSQDAVAFYENKLKTVKVSMTEDEATKIMSEITGIQTDIENNAYDEVGSLLNKAIKILSEAEHDIDEGNFVINNLKSVIPSLNARMYTLSNLHGSILDIAGSYEFQKKNGTTLFSNLISERGSNE